MTKVFVITNQHGHFINKHKEWVDGREPKLLFRSPHKDEALNWVFELSSKDIYLRAEVVSVALDDNKQPLVTVTAEMPAQENREQDSAIDEAIGKPPEETDTNDESRELETH